MDIKEINYNESSSNYKLFKEIFYEYKKKYKDYIFQKTDDISIENFYEDTKLMITNVRKIVDFYFYIISLDEELSDDENNFVNEIKLINENLIINITKINFFLEEFNRDEISKYLKKIFLVIEKNIIYSIKNINKIENLEFNMFRLKTLIYLKNTTKYLDLVKKNYELHINNYYFFNQEGDFLGISNEIRLISLNYKCVYEKYNSLCEYFSHSPVKGVFDEIETLINKVKETFVNLLKDHSVTLKKYC